MYRYADCSPAAGSQLSCSQISQSHLSCSQGHAVKSRCYLQSSARWIGVVVFRTETRLTSADRQQQKAQACDCSHRLESSPDLAAAMGVSDASTPAAL